MVLAFSVVGSMSLLTADVSTAFMYAPVEADAFFLHGYGRYVCREAQVTETNSDGGYVV